MKFWLLGLVNALIVDITQKNHDLLESTELFIVNFYAEWCRFSRQLDPILVKTEEAVRRGIFFFLDLRI